MTSFGFEASKWVKKIDVTNVPFFSFGVQLVIRENFSCFLFQLSDLNGTELITPSSSLRQAFCG
jgi:hypothetical protein